MYAAWIADGSPFTESYWVYGDLTYIPATEEAHSDAIGRRRAAERALNATTP